MIEKKLTAGAKGRGKKFAGATLAANRALASVAAGGALLAAVPSLPLAVLAGAVGEIIAYIVTNEIPSDGKS
jgi:hypothetical protein